MLNIETQFTKEYVERIVKTYEHDKTFLVQLLEPKSIDSKYYRIKMYHRKYRRTIIVTDFEEFCDILIMYSELK